MTDVIEHFLQRLHHPMLASIDMSLERMLRLLAVLGMPQKRLPPVIHVAGTNGKGSLIIYIQSILEAAGYRVHRYTSPHLVRFRERIIVQGKELDDLTLQKILMHVAGLLPQYPATFFEATTAAAFLAYSEHPADVLLLETGMGGRLDATNVITKPLLTAITPISMDHTEYLGTTLAAIAGEKAGIIKKTVPCVVGRQDAVAAEVIAKKAAELSAPLFRLGQEWNVEGNLYSSTNRGDAGRGAMDAQSGQNYAPTLTLPLMGREIKLSPSLAGTHQIDNAATAVACLEQLPQYKISDAHIAEGLANAVWPARLQRLSDGKLQKLLPNADLWLDGGHNAQGGEILGNWLASQRDKEIYLVCGMIKGKDTAAFLRTGAPHVKALYAVAIEGESTSQMPEAVAKAASGLGIEAHVAPSVQNALQTIAQRAKTPSIVCICGSLYLAGRVLADNE